MDRPLLLFRTLDWSLATPVVAGVRFREIDTIRLALPEALPLLGRLPSGLPLLDLGYLLAGRAGEGSVALETPTPGGPVAFLVEPPLDFRSVADTTLRALPSLLQPLVPYADAWSLAALEAMVLPLLDLRYLLQTAEATRLQTEASALVTMGSA